MFWLLFGLAVALPIGLVARVPDRWLGRAILLWVVSPALAYAGAVVWRGMTEGGPVLIDDAALGFVVLAAFLGIPWLFTCVVGIGLGLMLRRRASRG